LTKLTELFGCNYEYHLFRVCYKNDKNIDELIFLMNGLANSSDSMMFAKIGALENFIQ